MHALTFQHNGYSITVEAEFEKGYKPTLYDRGEPDWWTIDRIIIDDVEFDFYIEQLNLIKKILCFDRFYDFEVYVNDIFNIEFSDYVNYILYNNKPV